jgi:hypothetical protein
MPEGPAGVYQRRSIITYSVLSHHDLEQIRHRQQRGLMRPLLAV